MSLGAVGMEELDFAVCTNSDHLTMNLLKYTDCLLYTSYYP